ncbi:hypothetical protein N182_36435 [Sinorhizobium sp. GL2]|nr:hypothetical protein N182_36435 [Sinorhizobium sp. GL2]
MANAEFSGLSINPVLKVFDLSTDMLALSSPYGKSFLTSRVHIAIIRCLTSAAGGDAHLEQVIGDFGQATRIAAIDDLVSKRIIFRSKPLSGAALLAYAPDAPLDVVVPPVHVSGEPGADDVALCLERLGVPLVPNPQPGGFNVVLFADFLMDRSKDQDLHRLTRQSKPMIPAGMTSASAIVGPALSSSSNQCFMCVVESTRELNEVDAFLARFNEIAGGGPAPGLAAASFVASEVFKHCVQPETSVFNDHILTLELATGNIRKHLVRRRTSCPYCQPPNANSPLRRPQVIEPIGQAKANWTSGGMRVKSSSETLRVLRGLVSPLTGVVTSVTKLGDQIGSGDLHAYIATHPWNPRISTTDDLRKSLRHKSSGKGVDETQAEVSAIAEAVERYCGVFRGDEIRHTALLSPIDNRYIHPNSVALFSDRQHENHTDVDASGANWTPLAIPPEETIEWSPLWSLNGSQFKFLPTGMLYYFYEGPSSQSFLATSNGCASGNTVEEAIVQGFLELVERDAFGIWWYNQIERPLIPDNVIGKAASSHKRKLESSGVHVRYIDITTDLGIPCVAAIGVTDQSPSEIFVAAGCHFDLSLAVLRASTELVQHLYRGPAGAVERGSLGEWRMNSGATDASVAEISICYGDQIDEIERAKKICNEKGLELLVLDQSRSHVGFPTVRVVVPGLRHHWPRFAPGRLYEVPVRMGWLPSSKTEVQMTKIAPE